MQFDGLLYCMKCRSVVQELCNCSHSSILRLPFNYVFYENLNLESMQLISSSELVHRMYHLKLSSLMDDVL